MTEPKDKTDYEKAMEYLEYLYSGAVPSDRHFSPANEWENCKSTLESLHTENAELRKDLEKAQRIVEDVHNQLQEILHDR